MTIADIKVAVDCDPAGVEMKNVIVEHLKELGVDIVDLDYSGGRQALYPEIGFNLAMRIQEKKYDRGILICGTGLGMAMIANKVEGVFAGTCHDVFSAERLMKSNNATVLTMGVRVIGPELAKMIVVAFLESEFQAGRSAPKVEQMRQLEHNSFHNNE